MGHNFKKGMKVFIHSSKLSSKHIGLDSKGVMKSMVGRVWTLKRVAERRTYIQSPETDFVFTWHPGDMREAIIEEIKPIIVDFDEKLLDV